MAYKLEFPLAGGTKIVKWTTEEGCSSIVPNFDTEDSWIGLNKNDDNYEITVDSNSSSREGVVSVSFNGDDCTEKYITIKQTASTCNCDSIEIEDKGKVFPLNYESHSAGEVITNITTDGCNVTFITQEGNIELETGTTDNQTVIRLKEDIEANKGIYPLTSLINYYVDGVSKPCGKIEITQASETIDCTCGSISSTFKLPYTVYGGNGSFGEEVTLISANTYHCGSVGVTSDARFITNLYATSVDAGAEGVYWYVKGIVDEAPEDIPPAGWTARISAEYSGNSQITEPCLFDATIKQIPNKIDCDTISWQRQYDENNISANGGNNFRVGYISISKSSLDYISLSDFEKCFDIRISATNRWCEEQEEQLVDNCWGEEQFYINKLITENPTRTNIVIHLYIDWISQNNTNKDRGFDFNVEVYLAGKEACCFSTYIPVTQYKLGCCDSIDDINEVWSYDNTGGSITLGDCVENIYSSSVGEITSEGKTIGDFTFYFNAETKEFTYNTQENRGDNIKKLTDKLFYVNYDTTQGDWECDFRVEEINQLPDICDCNILYKLINITISTKGSERISKFSIPPNTPRALNIGGLTDNLVRSYYSTMCDNKDINSIIYCKRVDSDGNPYTGEDGFILEREYASFNTTGSLLIDVRLNNCDNTKTVYLKFYIKYGENEQPCYEYEDIYEIEVECNSTPGECGCQDYNSTYSAATPNPHVEGEPNVWLISANAIENEDNDGKGLLIATITRRLPDCLSWSIYSSQDYYFEEGGLYVDPTDNGYNVYVKFKENNDSSRDFSANLALLYNNETACTSQFGLKEFYFRQQEGQQEGNV